MRIVSRNAFAQLRQSRLERIATLLLLNHAHRLAHDHIRRRQIRFAEPETNAPRLRPIRNLPDHAFFHAAEKSWWLKFFRFDELKFVGLYVRIKRHQSSSFSFAS